MNTYRAKHDNVSESPVRTLYGRKGSMLLLPLDVCILQILNGKEEFRPSSEATRLIAAPIQDEQGGRMGLIAQYDWPPTRTGVSNPIVMVQLAPSANVKGIDDVREIACQVEVGDTVVCTVGGAEGTIVRSAGPCTYPDLTNQVEAYRVEFHQHVARRLHGAAIRLKTGELVGMLIATQNQESGACRALVFPA